MRHVKFYGFLLLGLFMTAAFPSDKTAVPRPGEAVESETPVANILSLSAKQADWVFSGAVTNESGERYNYYFELQRNDQQFQAQAILVDAQTGELVLHEQSDSLIDDPESSQWRVGKAFLRFNAINNSWIFGVKGKDRGFNFKVDMLGLSGTNYSRQQDIRNGIELLINQTGRLNGHLQTGENNQEQFVTAKKAWFRQVWVSKPQTLGHPMTAVLCEFNDGGGFYAVNLKEADALRGAVAGFRNEEGTAVPVSQFVTVKKDKSGLWVIHIPSPKLTLTLKDMLEQLNTRHQLVAGLVKGVKPGFCAISLQDIGQTPASPSQKTT